MFWRLIARPALFALPSESAHEWSMRAFQASMISPLATLTQRCLQVNDPRLKVAALDLEFANPVGLAAGFDKRATWFNSLWRLGFSHVEVGTITAQPQPGNPPPRLFRLPIDRALINRMGFNNPGASDVAQRLTQTESIQPVLGINIGKTKNVPLDEAPEDYLFTLRQLHAFANYVTINVSSPNTPGLRRLQDREPLSNLLGQLHAENLAIADSAGKSPIPILLKISPDLERSQLDDIVDIVQGGAVQGVIATNTTITRNPLKTPLRQVERCGPGGLSGGPLTERSRQVVKYLFTHLPRSVPIIGVGGIMSGADAWRMIGAGATLIQVYTGFVYGGPTFAHQLNQFLLKMLDQYRLREVGEAIGRDT